MYHLVEWRCLKDECSRNSTGNSLLLLGTTTMLELYNHARNESSSLGLLSLKLPHRQRIDYIVLHMRTLSFVNVTTLQTEVDQRGK